MAEESRKLRVSLSSAAIVTLGRIWAWNAQLYTPEHANRYIAFLREETNKLASEFFVGKPVPNRPKLSYITIRRSRRGHGHVAVYTLVGEVIEVVDFFHTAQDWQSRLIE